MKSKIKIVIGAPTAAGKTTIGIIIARALKDAGFNNVIQINKDGDTHARERDFDLAVKSIIEKNEQITIEEHQFQRKLNVKLTRKEKVEKLKEHYGVSHSAVKQAALEFIHSDKSDVIDFEYNKIKND